HSVDTKSRGQLEHLHDLLARGARGLGCLDVRTDSRLIEMSRRRIDGDVDELLRLRIEVILLPRHGGEVEIRLQEALIEAQDRIPDRPTGASSTDDVFLHRFLRAGHLGHRASCSSCSAVASPRKYAATSVWSAVGSSASDARLQYSSAARDSPTGTV